MRAFPLLLLLAATLTACDFGDGGSLYDPDAEGGPAPVIASIEPSGVVLAGIDVVTILGQNFSTTPEHNLVYFDDGEGVVERGTVLEASETRLRVRVPNLPNPNLRVRVAVRGAQDFSNAVPRPLAPAFVPFGDLDAGITEEPNGIVGDGSGFLYASLTQAGNSQGIKRFTPNGEREDYVTSRNVWSDLTFGSDGVLYGVFRVQALLRLPQGAPQQPVQPILPASVRLATVDRDADGNLWAAGEAGTPTNPVTPNIYRFNLAGTATPTPFPGSVRDLQAFGGSVYVAAVRTEGGLQAGVWKLPIQPDGTLGAEVLFYDMTADLGPNAVPSSLAIAADGTVFVGVAPPQGRTDVTIENPIIEVTPAGTASPLYPGVLPSPIQAMAWGEGSTLYVVQARRVVESGETADLLPAALFAVETRRQGAP